MTTVKSFTSKADIKVQASLWVSKIDRGLSNEDKLDFQRWVNQSNFHRKTLFSLAALWDDLSVLNELSAPFSLGKPMQKKHNIIAKYALAAGIAFILLFAGNIFLNIAPFIDDNNEKRFVEVRALQTEIGQQARFSLSDGSRINLNTNSVVEVSYSKNNRLLTLLKGEANFDVAKDKSRPFTVIVGEESFTALGTVFNVKRKSNQNMELVVTEGKVLMAKSKQPLNEIAKMLATLPKEELTGLLVTSGEIATIENNIHTSNKKASFEQIQRKLAWQQGMLVFNDKPLDEALAEISRYTPTTFKIKDAELNKIKVAGYFKANDIDGLLKSLSSNFNIQFEKANENVIHLSLNTSK